MRKILLKIFVLVGLLIPLSVSSATPASPINKRSYPFHNGEKMVFIAYYNWGPFWLKAGNVVFTTTVVPYHGKRVFHFEATGISFKKWNWLFKVTDYYQAYVRPFDLKPLFYEKKTMEGGYRIHNRYFLNNHGDSLHILTEATRKPLIDTVVPMQSELYDVITATYLLRSLNIDTIPSGDTISIPIILDGKIYTQDIVYVGKTVLKKGHQQIPALEFIMLLTESSFFSGENAVKLYLSDDEHRYPLYVRADIVVGSIKIYLKQYDDL